MDVEDHLAILTIQPVIAQVGLGGIKLKSRILISFGSLPERYPVGSIAGKCFAFLPP